MEISIKKYAEEEFDVATIQQYAEIRDVTRQTVYNWLKLEKIDYIKIPALGTNGVKYIKINK